MAGDAPPIDLAALEVEYRAQLEGARRIVAAVRTHDLGAMTASQARTAALLARRAVVNLLAAASALDHRAGQP